MPNSGEFKRDAKGMEAFIRSQVLGNAMYDVAQEGLKYAQSIAPVKTGQYQRSLSAEQVTVPVTKKSEPRAGAMISTDSPYGANVENQYKVLSRTADYLNRKGA